MDIHELLSTIDSLAKQNGLNRPFIVGGVPRDRVLGDRGKNINDLDITTGDGGSIKLGELLAKHIKNVKYRTYDDGHDDDHASANIMGLRIDFSNNFQIPNIDGELKKIGVKEITPMKREIYSRDFTINTLLEDLSLSNIYDITGEAEGDIKAGLIRCPIDPDITISNDPRRILRAIKFSLKYGFNIDDNLKTALSVHRKKIQDLPKGFVQDRMNEIVRLDSDKGIDLLIQYKLLPLVQLTKPIYDMLIKRKQLADYI
jgi:poly(A) polymerase